MAVAYENRYKNTKCNKWLGGFLEKIRKYLWKGEPIVYPDGFTSSFAHKTRVDDLMQLADFIKYVFPHVCEETFNIPYQKLIVFKKEHPYDKPDYSAFETAIRTCMTKSIQDPVVIQFGANNYLPSSGPSRTS